MTKDKRNGSHRGGQPVPAPKQGTNGSDQKGSGKQDALIGKNGNKENRQ